MFDPFDDDFPLPRVPSVVQMANEVLDMHHELRRLRVVEADYEKLKRDHHELLMGSINHGNRMIGGLFALAMKPGVLEAIGKANAMEGADHG